MKNLNDLAINHPYYTSEVNFFTNKFPAEWETMGDFLDEFENADIDMNLVFRWDILPVHEDEFMETGEIVGYRAQITMIHQRKGIYAPHMIKCVAEKDVPRLVDYLKVHKNRLYEIWKPL